MKNRFTQKVAVITGAAQGIGQRVAERMAAEKGRLVLVDRSELVHEVAEGLKARTAPCSASPPIWSNKPNASG